MIHPSPKTAFVTRLKKASRAASADESLRWNQVDVANTVAKFLGAKEGASFDSFGKDIPEDELQTKKGKTNAAMIESSPGSGKTRIMGTLAKVAANLNGYKDNTDAIKVLLLTPRLDLNQQTLKELDEELGIKDKDVAVFDSHQSMAQKKRAKHAPVLVGTYQSIPKMLQEGVISLDPKSPQYRGLVLMDEAHELQDFSYQPKPGATPLNIASFVNDHQMTFLFTGTDDGVSQRHFGGKVPTIYSKRLVKAHNEGLTCEHIHPGLVDIGVKTRDWKEHIDQAKKDAGEHHQELLEYFSGHPKVIEAAVETQLTAKEPYMGPLNRYKAIFFVDGKKPGEDGAHYYNKRAKELGLNNLKADYINADTSKDERKRILRDYKAGKTTAIFNDRILTFGFDDRETAVIHDLKMHDRNTRALAKMEQIFTRGTRKCEWFKDKYGREKQALLLSYRPIGPDGEPVNLLTAADLLQGLQIKPREFGRGDGWEFNGDGEKKKKSRSELSNEFDVHIHFDFGEQMHIAEIMREAHEAALRAAEEAKEIPKTDDGREYVAGPLVLAEGLKYQFFNKKIKAAEAVGAYTTAEKVTVSADKIRTNHKSAANKSYIHPDVAADLEKQFAEVKHTEVPKTNDGREYIEGPSSGNEQIKYQFYTNLIKKMETDGFHLPNKKISVQANKIKAAYQRRSYIHPDVAAWLEERFVREKQIEIPVTNDARKYVPAPDSNNDGIKWRFFSLRIKAAQANGSYTIEGKPAIPGDKIAVMVWRTKYLHPDVAADLEKTYEAEKVTEIPTAKDGREYVRMPLESELVKRRFFNNNVASAIEAGEYKLKGKRAISADQITIMYNRTKYIHPDVADDLENRFSLEKHTEIPTTKDGREYVQGPIGSIEKIKYKFFFQKLKDAEATGSYKIKGKRDVPSDKITAIYDAKKYIHPDVAEDLETRFSLEKHTEIPTTEDGREYIKGPNTRNEVAKASFFRKRIKDASATGVYVLENRSKLASDKISAIYNKESYIHPDVAADLAKRYEKVSPTSIPTTEDGREYVPAPHTEQMHSKAAFFYLRTSKAKKSGHYTLEGKPAIPADEITKTFSHRGYIHPDVAADIESQYEALAKKKAPDTNHTDRVKPRSLKPDSADLKRTGHRRGVEE